MLPARGLPRAASNRLFFAASLAFVPAGAAQAQNYYFNAPYEAPIPGPLSVQAQLAETLEDNSNPLLLTTGARPVFGAVTEPLAVISGQTETLRLDWTNRLDDNEFNQRSFSSRDVHSKAITRLQWQTGYLRLTSSYDYDTTRTSEFLTSGVNIAGIRHQDLQFAPEMAVLLTQQDHFIIDAAYQRTEYAQTNIFKDYLFLTASPQYVHDFTLRDSGLLLAQLSHFNTSSGLLYTENALAGGGGWQHRVSNGFTMYGFAGEQYTAISSQGYPPGTPSQNSNQLGPIFNGRLNFTGLRDTIVLSASRSLLPQGIGVATEQLNLTVSEAHQFTPRLLISGAASYLNDNYTGVDVSRGIAYTGGTKSLLQLNASAQYQLTEYAAIALTVSYKNKQFVSSTANAPSNGVLINLILTPHAAIFGF